LTVTADGLAVKIQAWSSFTNEHAFSYELVQILLRLGIDLSGVRIDRQRQVDLGTVHVQQVQGLVMGEGVGLHAIDDIIRHSGNSGGVLGNGDKTLKGTKTHGARMVDGGR
jgi:hypothetical protein